MNTNYTPRTPQDDFDSGNDDVDPIIIEANEDITETLHISAEDFKQRINENEVGETEQAEDTREELEDRDQETY